MSAPLREIKQLKMVATLLGFARYAAMQSANKAQSEMAILDRSVSEHIQRNEFDDALRMLEEMAATVPCRGGFWRDLERAANAMNRPEKAQYYRRRFLETRPPA